jgi:outer membrane protein assembly factor BamB
MGMGSRKVGPIIRSFALLLVSTSAFQALGQWPMAGANRQRTSWVPEQVPAANAAATSGHAVLSPVWYRPVEPFIPGRVQVVAAHNLLYLATAAGLYAFHESGEVAWQYATSMPLGHSPTIDGEVAYAGCFDGRIYAVNAHTGELLGVSPPAGAGFQTNPLVVDGVVYAGSRDGYFYSWRLGEDTWQWRFPALGQPPLPGPILFSAAYHEEDRIIYFAANDGHAYAVHPDGRLHWKSDRLPGEGFRSWWPVIHGDSVILAGSSARRSGIAPRTQDSDIQGAQRDYFFPKGLPKGTLRSVRENSEWLDTSRSWYSLKGLVPSNSDYSEDFPEDRTYLVLDRRTGREIVYDFDGDGKPESAPILWWGTRGGNRYPPLVAADGNLYQTNMFLSDDWIPGGNISGWRVHTPFINTPVSRWAASDEPIAYSAGGRYIYWNHGCDRTAGTVDILAPNSSFPVEDRSREWWHFSYNLDTLIPGYNAMMDGIFQSPHSGLPDCPGPYGGPNGVYQAHSSDQNPPIPYKGHVYSHRGNAIIAMGHREPAAKPLPLVAAPASRPAPVAAITIQDVRVRLVEQVERILNAGHLRPGWGHHGLIDRALVDICGDNLQDYWKNPADTHIALLGALPHLPSSLQVRLVDYLRREMEAYPVHRFPTIGWGSGQPRERFSTALPESTSSAPSEWGSHLFLGWTQGKNNGPRLPPYAFYALWKFAAATGDAAALFESSRDRLSAPPVDEVLMKFPFVHNAYIAGYMGYLELERLAGYPESDSIRRELDRLLALRVETFATDTPYQGNPIATVEANCRVLTVSRNFIHLVPELAAHLKAHASHKVREAVAEYERVAPFWFVAFPETGFGEGTLSPLYDRLLFLAKAWVLDESRENLLPYLDVEGFPQGDLIYVQLLTAAIEAGSRPAGPEVEPVELPESDLPGRLP